MINEYYLPGLNDKSQNVSLQNDITNKDTPKIYLFLTNTFFFQLKIELYHITT